MPDLTTEDPWISFAQAQRSLGIGYAALRELTQTGRLSVRRVPGSRPRVNLAEVERLAIASTTPATQG